jgi:hypothetical protein
MMLSPWMFYQRKWSNILSHEHAKISGIFANHWKRIFDDLLKNPGAEDKARVAYAVLEHKRLC